MVLMNGEDGRNLLGEIVSSVRKVSDLQPGDVIRLRGERLTVRAVKPGVNARAVTLELEATLWGGDYLAVEE